MRPEPLLVPFLVRPASKKIEFDDSLRGVESGAVLDRSQSRLRSVLRHSGIACRKEGMNAQPAILRP